MLERCQKKGTQAPLLLSHGLEIVAFQNPRKKPLGDIFRFLWLNTPLPHEAVNRPPVRAAKFLQRFLRRGGFASRLQDYTPMRCRKRYGFALREHDGIFSRAWRRR